MRFQGIPILKTLVVWASPSHITLAIWVAGNGDAQNADMPISLDTGHFSQRGIGFSKQSIFLRLDRNRKLRMKGLGHPG